MESVPLPGLDDRDVVAIDATLPRSTGPGRAGKTLAAAGERIRGWTEEASRFVADHAVSSVVVAALGGAAAMKLLLRGLGARRP